VFWQLVAVAAAFCFGGGQVAAAGELQRFEYSQVHMGGLVRLVMFAPDESMAVAAGNAAFARIGRLEQIFSDYRPDSELMQLCAAAGQGPRLVSQELVELLEASLQLAERSGGAFDPTMGPLTLLWRQARQAQRMPTDEEIAAAGVRTGWRKVKLNKAERTVELMENGMRLDLGGIAKGYTGDEVVRVLAEHGVDRALFEAGGDLVVSGPPPGARGWVVRKASSAADGGAELLTVAHAAVSTSGDTEQFMEVDGVRYSHTLDPRTGTGLTARFLATVVAPSGLMADGLATAATVLGPGEAARMAAEHYPQAEIFVSRIFAGPAD
jgi:FAD:protein FMN transferase